MYKGLINIALLIAVILTACGDNAIYNTQVDLPKEGWSATDTQFFEVDMSEVTTPVSVTAKFRITPEYPKENLYLKIFTIAPDGKQEERVVSVTLADPFGKWTGKGVGDLLAYEHTFIANTLLNQGVYTFGIMQYMRYEVLPDVHDVGIMVQPVTN